MKKLFSAFLVFSLYSSIGFGQQKELTDLVAQLQTLCARVESGSKNYEQEIKLTEYSSIQYTAVEIDQKGNKNNLFTNSISLTSISTRPAKSRKKT